MNTNELNAYAVAALLNLVGGVSNIDANKIYQMNADIKFIVKDGKAEAVDVLRIFLAEKPEHE